MKHYKVTASVLNVRSDAGTDASIIAKLSQGDLVTQVSTNSDGSWSKITYQEDGSEHSGWVFNTYLEQVPEAVITMQVTASALNIRSGPGTQNEVIGQLLQNALVQRERTNDDTSWSYITAQDNALAGWVSSAYLRTPVATIDTDNAPTVITNAVIDLSHHNTLRDINAVKDDGISSIIHKATQGTGFVDDQYEPRRPIVTNAGLLWGAYHFGTAADAISQAQHFLDTAQPDANTLLVLDFETDTTSSNGQSMSLQQARDFVSYVREQTGRWPGLYGGSYLKELLGNAHDEVLSRCWLWMAQYGNNVTIPACWPTWTLWQYTDGENGPTPHSVNGVGNCDRDKFNGDAAALQTFWVNAGRE
ncbi:GH25 family lysozyme [Pseudomonadota bacterium]